VLRVCIAGTTAATKRCSQDPAEALLLTSLPMDPVQTKSLEENFECQDDLAIVAETSGNSGDEISVRIRKAVRADVCGWAVDIQIRVVQKIVEFSAELQLCSLPRQGNVLEQRNVLVQETRLAERIAWKRTLERPIHGDLAAEWHSVGDASTANWVINLVQPQIQVVVRRDGIRKMDRSGPIASFAIRQAAR
jgi:hypothetical protein